MGDWNLKQITIALLFFLGGNFLVLSSGCGVKTGLKPEVGLNPQNIATAHYTYEDQLVTLAARIRPAELAGSYEYEFLIMNKGVTPLPMHYYSDILTLSYSGKVFSVRKETKLKEYPHTLKSGEYFVAIFKIDGIFSNAVYQIDKLTFKLGEKRYTLNRNPRALWQDKESLL